VKVKFCSKCGGLSKVFDTRVLYSGVIIRKRICLECGHKWKTIEVMMEEKAKE
jgi:transcriptional regulator NrdR family protein